MDYPLSLSLYVTRRKDSIILEIIGRINYNQYSVYNFERGMGDETTGYI